MLKDHDQQVPPGASNGQHNNKDVREEGLVVHVEDARAADDDRKRSDTACCTRGRQTASAIEQGRSQINQIGE